MVANKLKKGDVEVHYTMGFLRTCLIIFAVILLALAEQIEAVESKEELVLTEISHQNFAPASRVIIMESSREGYTYAITDSNMSSYRFNGFGDKPLEPSGVVNTLSDLFVEGTNSSETLASEFTQVNM